MARARDPNREKSFEIWKEHKGNITNRAIAEQLNVPEKTIGAWKSKDKWNGKLNGVLQSKIRSTPNTKVAKKARSPSISNVEEPIVESEELTDKQRDFCFYYVKYRNKTKAYMKAYECSWKTANAHAYRMWENEGVRKEIDRLLSELRDEVKLDSQDILQKYIDIAFADITDFVEFGQKEIEAMGMFGPIKDEDGNQVMVTVNYVDFKNHDVIDGTLITEVKKGKDGVSVKLADKMKALDFLAKSTDILSESDRKKLQEEKLKTEIAKTKAEVEKITTGNDDKPIEIVIKRKGKS
jgi:phage terminase small subunit